MDCTLKVNEQTLIKANGEKDGVWTFDNKTGLNIEPTREGLLITPSDDALQIPERVLEFKISETKELVIYNLTIVNEEGKVDLALPKTLKMSSDEELLIPHSKNYLDGTWSFSQSSLNSGLSLSKEGVTLKNIPAGHYTLQYEADDDDLIIAIRCFESSSKSEKVPQVSKSSEIPSPDNKREQVSSNNILETEDITVTSPQSVDLEAYPEIKLPCKLQLIVKGVVEEEIYIKKTESILIGRLSLAKEIVDLDLTKYTKKIGDISRNHLKIWYNEPHLFMKNIGSRKVLFKGQEMYPEDEAVLSANCIINIADLVLKVIEEEYL